MSTIAVNEMNPWPLLPYSRKQYVMQLTRSQFCELRKLHETNPPYNEETQEEDTAVDAFWMRIGKTYGLQWWTMQAILNKPMYFMMELM